MVTYEGKVVTKEHEKDMRHSKKIVGETETALPNETTVVKLYACLHATLCGNVSLRHSVGRLVGYAFTFTSFSGPVLASLPLPRITRLILVVNPALFSVQAHIWQERRLPLLKTAVEQQILFDVAMVWFS